MSRIAVCRICLTTDVNMHNISKSKVLEVFEKLTSKKLPETNRPSTICYLCYSLLNKCSRMLNMFRKTENVFEQLSCSGIEITSHTISFLKKSNVVDLLITPLTHIDVKPMDQGNKQTVKSKIKNLQDVIIKEEPKDEPIEVKLEAIESGMECDIALQDVLYEDTYEESDDSAKDSTWDAVKEEKRSKNKSKKTRGQDMENNKNTNDKSSLIQIDPKKPHSCKICSKTFEKISRLQKHIKKHNSKNHVCSICCETFSFKSNLIRHEEIFHTKKKHYSCDECNKSFTRSDHLRKHVMSHRNVKPYPCSICNKMFTTTSNVQQHINSIHLHEKPFACDQCDKTFNRKGNLQEHYRTHTGAKPFNCNKCDMQFSHLSNLKSHKFKMHSD